MRYRLKNRLRSCFFFRQERREEVFTNQARKEAIFIFSKIVHNEWKTRRKVTTTLIRNRYQLIFIMGRSRSRSRSASRVSKSSKHRSKHKKRRTRSRSSSRDTKNHRHSRVRSRSRDRERKRTRYYFQIFIKISAKYDDCTHAS